MKFTGPVLVQIEELATIVDFNRNFLEKTKYQRKRTKQEEVSKLKWTMNMETMVQEKIYFFYIRQNFFNT